MRSGLRPAVPEEDNEEPDALEEVFPLDEELELAEVFPLELLVEELTPDVAILELDAPPELVAPLELEPLPPELDEARLDPEVVPPFELALAPPPPPPPPGSGELVPHAANTMKLTATNAAVRRCMATPRE